MATTPPAEKPPAPPPPPNTIKIDGREIPFKTGDTIIRAASSFFFLSRVQMTCLGFRTS